jgi:hypothetical protein
MSENVVLDKSYKFAIRIVKLYKYLTEEKKEFVMSKSLFVPWDIDRRTHQIGAGSGIEGRLRQRDGSRATKRLRHRVLAGPSA